MSLRSKTATSRIVGAMGHIMASRGPCRIIIARQPVEMQIQKKVNGLPSDWRLPVWTSLFGVLVLPEIGRLGSFLNRFPIGVG